MDELEIQCRRKNHSSLDEREFHSAHRRVHWSIETHALGLSRESQRVHFSRDPSFSHLGFHQYEEYAHRSLVQSRCSIRLLWFVRFLFSLSADLFFRFIQAGAMVAFTAGTLRPAIACAHSRRIRCLVKPLSL